MTTLVLKSRLAYNLLFCIFILIAEIVPVTSQIKKDTVITDFKILDQFLANNSGFYNSSEFLVVFDIDNTLLVSDSDLGSDFWFQWQNEELDVHPKPGQKLTRDCLFNEAVGLLYEVGTMSASDSLLPVYFKKWQTSNFSIMALTSRNPDCRGATERELLRNKIDFSVNEPIDSLGKKLVLNDKLTRRLSYSGGILMTTGMNKGDMIDYFIKRSGISYKAIIFVDDSPKNINAVRTKFINCKITDVYLFNYTKVIRERFRKNNNHIFTEEQTQKMASDWVNLVKTLNVIFPSREQKCNCF